MIVDAIAKKCSAHLYSKLGEEMLSAYSFEAYSQLNKQYFLELAGIYLQVKGYLEVSDLVADAIYNEKRTEERILLTKSIFYSSISDAYKKDDKS